MSNLCNGSSVAAGSGERAEVLASCAKKSPMEGRTGIARLWYTPESSDESVRPSLLAFTERGSIFVVVRTRYRS